MSQYDDLSKEELLKLLGQKDEELKSKKYGLVWDAEREPEQVVLDCENNFPILQRVKGKEIRTCDEDDNILIEGDNYHALTVLNYTHKGKIDVIYIDPPYNTGKLKEWKYNDSYIDINDGYRHSKWLNMIEKRLRLAKELLKDSGVIFISIDNNEIAQLKMLCDKIFDEKNFINNLIWQRASGGGNAQGIVTGHDYILVYQKDLPIINFLGDKVEASRFGQDKIVIKENGDKFYINDDIIRKVFGKYESGVERRCYYEELGQYKNNQQIAEIESKLKSGEYFLIKQKNNKNFIARLDSVEKRKKMYSIIQGVLNNEGSNELLDMGINFDYPKPIGLIKKIINSIDAKNLNILDFFAGSGTTGHAVLSLNNEDGGNRKFVLCTNNEENICTEVCHPRIKKAIKGYKKNGNGEKVEGLGGNLQYFKTALVKKTINRTQMKIDLTQRCAQMLCVKENIFNLEKEKEDYAIFSSNKKERFLCVYYNFLEKSFDEFLKEIKKLKGKKIVYMFSTGDKVDKSLFAGVNDVVIEAIPQKILDVYKKLAKMNIPVQSDTLVLDFNKAKEKVFDEKEKDEGARLLRIVLAKLIQKIAQINGINILKENSQEEKISSLNDRLKNENILSQIEWEENKTYFAIGNQAAHGEYGEYDLGQVENFYKHIQTLLNKHNI